MFLKIKQPTHNSLKPTVFLDSTMYFLPSPTPKKNTHMTSCDMSPVLSEQSHASLISTYCHP